MIWYLARRGRAVAHDDRLDNALFADGGGKFIERPDRKVTARLIWVRFDPALNWRDKTARRGAPSARNRGDIRHQRRQPATKTAAFGFSVCHADPLQAVCWCRAKSSTARAR